MRKIATPSPSTTVTLQGLRLFHVPMKLLALRDGFILYVRSWCGSPDHPNPEDACIFCCSTTMVTVLLRASPLLRSALYRVKYCNRLSTTLGVRLIFEGGDAGLDEVCSSQVLHTVACTKVTFIAMTGTISPRRRHARLMGLRILLISRGGNMLSP